MCLMAPVRILDVQVERLLVEDRRGGVLVLVGHRPTLIIPFMNVDERQVLLGHDVRAGDGGGDVGYCKVQSGYLDRSSIALNLPVASWRCWKGLLCV